MFGIYRYVLAVMVASGHIQFRLFDRPNWLGVYAVFGFYALSGYLMTRVLHETYGYRGQGFLRYIANRALRIYPPYWVAILATLALLYVWPDVPGRAGWLVRLPDSTDEVLRNLALLGVHVAYTPAFVPTAWSLHVEFIFYILMGLGLSSSRWRVALWVVASVAWTGWALSIGTPFGSRYSTVIGGSLPFSLGAAAYFFPIRWHPSLLALPVMFLPHALAAPWLWSDVYSTGFYFSFAIALASILALAPLRARGSLKFWDQRLGDLSYPIFLLHTQVGFLIGKLGSAYLKSPFWVFVAALPVLHLLAIAMHGTVVVGVEHWRNRIRRRHDA